MASYVKLYLHAILHKSVIFQQWIVIIFVELPAILDSFHQYHTEVRYHG